MHISQSHAMRAASMTPMAKLEYAKRASKLVDVKAVRFHVFKAGREALNVLMALLRFHRQ